ncbi:hypothetical protein pb186bvf_007663 [Paramecium bursaria]
MLFRLVNFKNVSTLPRYSHMLYGKAFQGLDPAKHIYMNKQAQNCIQIILCQHMMIYSNWVNIPMQLGWLIELNGLHYVAPVLSIIENHLREVYPNHTFVASNNYDQLVYPWQHYGITNIESQISPLLTKLAHGIVVKESKLTWTKEQRLRLEQTHDAFRLITIKDDDPVYFFVKIYQDALWMIVDHTNLFRSREIVEENSPLEKQIELESNPKPVIESIYRDIPKNNRWTTKLLKLIH